MLARLVLLLSTAIAAGSVAPGTCDLATPSVDVGLERRLPARFVNRLTGQVPVSREGPLEAE